MLFDAEMIIALWRPGDIQAKLGAGVKD